MHQHIVLVGVAFVARDDPATEHGLYSACHGFNRHAHVGRAVAVNFHEELGFVQLQVDVGLHDAGVLAHRGHELPRHTGHVVVAVAADNHVVDRALTKALPQAGRRDGEHSDAGQGAELGQQLARELHRGDIAFRPIGRAQHAKGCGHLATPNEQKAAIKFSVL